MKCSKCGFENPSSFKFCGQCGAKLEVINKCPNCGFENPKSFRLCFKCGAKLINKCPDCGSTFPSYAKFCPECGSRVLGEPIDACPADLEFVVGSCRFKMIKVEGGTFTMGAKGNFVLYDEVPIHQVTLSDYYIGQTEVTQELWTAVMGDNPSEFKGDNLPVEGVSWDDCQFFIEKLNLLLSKELGGKSFALPTEAQWEFAARGGNKSKGYKYAGSNNIDDVAWYIDNSGGMSHPVAQKQPNELGLYDMSGNVDEWCQDWYEEDYYRISPKNNPQGPASGTCRMSRGGSWYDDASSRVSARNFNAPDDRGRTIGFRLCLIP